MVVLLLAGCAGGKQKTMRADQLTQLGRAKLGEGNPEGALADLNQAYELRPENAETLHFLGMAWWYKGRVLKDERQLAKAEGYILESLKRNDNSEWRNNLCALYVDLGQFDNALRECKTASDDPDYRTPERAYNNAGRALMEKGRYRRALEELERALTLQPQSCQALWNKGAAHKALKEWDDALEALARVNRVCPSYPEPYLLKGQVLYFGKRDREAAVVALQRAEKLDPRGDTGKQAKKLLREIPR